MAVLKWRRRRDSNPQRLALIFDIFVQQVRAAQNLLESDLFEYLLSDKQRQLWQWAAQQEQFTRKMAVETLGFAPRTVETVIKKLLDMNRLERLGQGRATRYRIIKSMRL